MPPPVQVEHLSRDSYAESLTCRAFISLRKGGFGSVAPVLYTSLLLRLCVRAPDRGEQGPGSDALSAVQMALYHRHCRSRVEKLFGINVTHPVAQFEQ